MIPELPSLTVGLLTLALQLMTLPLKQPYLPMEAKSAEKLPVGDAWQYEPKWDGFRCIAFRDGDRVELQSKSAQPLARYFPELVEALLKLRPKQFVIDGEIVVPIKGKFSFDDLLMRIHPAASRVKKLAQETPAKLIVFDLLVNDRGKALVDEVLTSRRKKLDAFAKKYFPNHKSIELSPQTDDLTIAKHWLAGAGVDLDGVIPTHTDMPYPSGSRHAT